MTGSDQKHHALPQADFPDFVDAPDNKIPCSYQEHLYAHYLLALAVPECASYQMTVCLMARARAADIRADELPYLAEVYARAQTAFALLRTHEHQAKAGRAGGKIGGKTQGTKNKENKLGICGLTLEQRQASGSKGALAQTREQKQAAGGAGGTKTASIPGALAKAGRAGGQKSGLLVCHTRWHVNRGIKSAECALC
jgi:hypothetical protein